MLRCNETTAPRRRLTVPAWLSARAWLPTLAAGRGTRPHHIRDICADDARAVHPTRVDGDA